MSTNLTLVVPETHAHELSLVRDAPETPRETPPEIPSRGTLAPQSLAVEAVRWVGGGLVGGLVGLLIGYPAGWLGGRLLLLGGRRCACGRRMHGPCAAAVPVR